LPAQPAGWRVALRRLPVLPVLSTGRQQGRAHRPPRTDCRTPGVRPDPATRLPFVRGAADGDAAVWTEFLDLVDLGAAVRAEAGATGPPGRLLPSGQVGPALGTEFVVGFHSGVTFLTSHVFFLPFKGRRRPGCRPLLPCSSGWLPGLLALLHPVRPLPPEPGCREAFSLALAGHAVARAHPAFRAVLVLEGPVSAAVGTARRRPHHRPVVGFIYEDRRLGRLGLRTLVFFRRRFVSRSLAFQVGSYLYRDAPPAMPSPRCASGVRERTSVPCRMPARLGRSRSSRQPVGISVVSDGRLASVGRRPHSHGHNPGRSRGRCVRGESYPVGRKVNRPGGLDGTGFAASVARMP